MTRVISRLSVVVMFVACLGVVGSAHPGSTTAVVITTPEGGVVEAALHTDARALVAKLAAAADAPLTSDERTPEELAARVAALATALLDDVDLRVDGHRLELSLVDVDVDQGGQAVVRLRAPLATDARVVTWSTGLVYGAYPVSLRQASGQELVRWLQGREATEPLPLKNGGRATAVARGIWLGFTHILPYGLDHILFVVGLVLLGTRPGPLFVQVSAFTVAHSVTLALGLYGLVSLSPAIVEPLIALSVAYVGLENIFARRLTRWRVGVVFAFGLLHGLGFAGILTGLNLAPVDLFSTLASFNIGVELGQLAVVATSWVVMYRLVPVWRETVARVVSAGVAATGLFWTFERVWS
jgi:hydrogenase/urease accessory protein HupE